MYQVVRVGKQQVRYLQGGGAVPALDVIKAIARGFSPERAFNLFKDDTLLKIIDITDYAGKNSST